MIDNIVKWEDKFMMSISKTIIMIILMLSLSGCSFNTNGNINDKVTKDNSTNNIVTLSNDIKNNKGFNDDITINPG